MEIKDPPLLSSILLAISIAILLSSGTDSTETMSQSLCPAQFALANEACGFLHPPLTGDSEPRPSELLASTHVGQHPTHGDDLRDSECCRRLSSVDDECVCQATARLPPFITRPQHIITVDPSRGCKVSFRCDRLII